MTAVKSDLNFILRPLIEKMASSQLKHARRTSLQRDQKILTIELKHVFARHRRANSISADLTDLIGGAGGQQLDYDLVPFSPGQASWSWLDQSALPVVSASSAAITDAEAGTYTALVFAGTTGISAVAFTILGDAAAEFNVNVDAAGSGVGERDSGNRSIGDLIGTGNHNLDGGDGNDAFYGNYG